jgi:hypothetical protein
MRRQIDRKIKARQVTCRAFVLGTWLVLLGLAAPTVAAGAVLEVAGEGALVPVPSEAAGHRAGYEGRTAQVVGAPPGGGVVCFYKSPGFAGAKWCVRSGAMMRRITRAGWDNGISSVRMSPGVSIRVCTNAGYAGECAILSRDWRQLDRFDDAISSFQVYSGDPRAL